MSRCGRCKGRAFIKELHGLGIKECPDCTKGIKTPKSTLGSRTVSVSIDGARCVVCNEPAVQGHHVVPQSRIDRFVLAELTQEAKADRRNVTPLCHQCHSKVEAAALDLAPHELPNGFWAFVAYYSLEPALPRYLMERTATP